jgi:hypothetical protein
MELGERGKGKEYDSISNITKYNICEGRGYRIYIESC